MAVPAGQIAACEVARLRRPIPWQVRTAAAHCCARTGWLLRDRAAAPWEIGSGDTLCGRGDAPGKHAGTARGNGAGTARGKMRRDRAARARWAGAAETRRSAGHGCRSTGPDDMCSRRDRRSPRWTFTPGAWRPPYKVEIESTSCDHVKVDLRVFARTFPAFHRHLFHVRRRTRGLRRRRSCP